MACTRQDIAFYDANIPCADDLFVKLYAGVRERMRNSPYELVRKH